MSCSYNIVCRQVGIQYIEKNGHVVKHPVYEEIFIPIKREKRFENIVRELEEKSISYDIMGRIIITECDTVLDDIFRIQELKKSFKPLN